MDRESTEASANVRTCGPKVAPAVSAAATGVKSPASRPLTPATMTIFGAGGDLTRRLVIPALYHLVRAGELPRAALDARHSGSGSDQAGPNE